MSKYWHWFFRGEAGRPGYRRLLSHWMWLHISVSVLLALLVPMPLATIGRVILIPAAGTLVATSFAWIATAFPLLQSDELRAVVAEHDEGCTPHVFVFRNAVLVILTTQICWAMAGLRVFSSAPLSAQTALKALFFLITCMAIHECWSLVGYVQFLLLMWMNARNAVDRTPPVEGETTQWLVTIACPQSAAAGSVTPLCASKQARGNVRTSASSATPPRSR